MIRGILRVRLLTWLVGLGLCVAGGRGLLAQAPAQGAPALPAPINESDDPILKPFVWRSIGPANMGGRVDDIAVVEATRRSSTSASRPAALKSTNNGTT